MNIRLTYLDKMNQHPVKTKKHISPQRSFRESILGKILNNSVHHANLIYGPKGTGKATVIYSIIKDFIIESCGGIEYEKQIEMVESFTHPDILTIDNINQEVGQSGMFDVDTSRKIIDFCNLKPSVLEKKFIIIDCVENMNENACNAILKILEEPRQGTYFFLISNNKNSLMRTILSRCVQYKYPLLDYQNFKIIMKEFYFPEKELTSCSIITENSPGLSLLIKDTNGIVIYQSILSDILKNSRESIDLIKKTNKNQYEVIMFFFLRLIKIILIKNIKKDEIENEFLSKIYGSDKSELLFLGPNILEKIKQAKIINNDLPSVVSVAIGKISNSIFKK